MLMGYGGQDLGSRSFRDATWVSVLRLRVSSFVFKVEAQPPELLDPELNLAVKLRRSMRKSIPTAFPSSKARGSLS